MSLLERIYFLHDRIQQNRFPNASDLIEEFEISQATAHRDIGYLRDRLLAPLAFNQKKNGYYYTAEGFRLPFEDSSKIILFLGLLASIGQEAGLADLPELVQLRKKLTYLAAPGQTNLQEIIHCEWIETEPVATDVFQAVLQSFQEKCQLTIYYQKAETVTKRTVDPLKLIHYQGRWYLYGWCMLRGGKRLFHLSRIKQAQVEATQAIHVPTDDINDITGVFGIFKGKAKTTVRIQFTGNAAQSVRYQRWHPFQTIEENDKGIILTLPVADEREILMKILQFGSQAQVLKPESLKRQIALEISAMEKLYAATADSPKKQ
ncbi:helix-turn-helix transcriptional regulator [Desulfogranum japonicum]|uniref:helix-turn-helix transcriptional regulator n=1 Tax=Desulfogranum japonicum TaxID=231447 RepID=UPI00041FFCAB|nr:WYL domain-containing protein [Desulfogranum japonicum]